MSALALPDLSAPFLHPLLNSSPTPLTLMADTTDIPGLYGKPPKKKSRRLLSRAAQQQAEIDALDEQWQQPKIEALHNAIQANRVETPPPPIAPPPQDYGYLHDLRLDDEAINNRPQQQHDHQNQPPQPPRKLHSIRLDANSPLILVKGTNEPRLWRKPFSSAVDAYRSMIRMQDELAVKALKISKMEELSSNCPRCFGPSAAIEDMKADVEERMDEPHYIVCFDGNYQQRRHLAASKEYEDITIRYPSLFLDPKFVDEWKPGAVQNRGLDEPLDPCSAQHTTADDKRNASTFKGSDESGLVGMACRHDHCLGFVNVVQSGEKAHFVHALLANILSKTDEPEGNPKRLGILYDIGCHLEKGIKKHNLFQEERENGQLKFGTSAWHALVHIYTCQLKYNPRLLKGFGRSDGEGLERIWRQLSRLISYLRYSSKQHRLDALNLLALHINEICRMNAARSAACKLAKHQSELMVAQATLTQLSFGPNQEPNARPCEYFADQWERKRTCLLEFSEDNTTASLEKSLARLMDLEEQLHAAHIRVGEIRSRRQNQRSESDLADLEDLPSAIVLIEEGIDEVVPELGGDEFKNHPALRDPRARAVIRMRVAKGKLFEAKVSIIELQRDWDEPGQGTRSQQRYKDLMKGKEKTFKQKYTAYIRQVKKYNTFSPRLDRLPLPTLKNVESYPIEDQFWNIGHLTHPSEPWANDRDTRIGIEAYLTVRSCQEELRRIAHEVRAMMRSALQRFERLVTLSTMANQVWDPICPNRARPIKLVHQSGLVSRGLWEKSIIVLKVLHKGILQRECRTWMVWGSRLPALLMKTQQYSDTTQESDNRILASWHKMISDCLRVWEGIVRGSNFTAEELDPEEIMEQEFFIGDGAEYNPLERAYVHAGEDDDYVHAGQDDDWS
ncbi:hypothetical protein DFH28DRAFT_1220476 [Melampsora americana]|nr:hypothetical protein DFH28DRAFT_1220476 [Melampsora americana]